MQDTTEVIKQSTANFWGANIETDWKEETPAPEPVKTEPQKPVADNPPTQAAQQATATPPAQEFSEEIAHSSGKVAVAMYKEAVEGLSELMLMWQFNRRSDRIAPPDELEQLAEAIDNDNENIATQELAPELKVKKSKLLKLLNWQAEAMEKIPFTDSETENAEAAFRDYFTITRQALDPKWILAFGCIAPIIKRSRVILMPQ